MAELSVKPTAGTVLLIHPRNIETKLNKIHLKPNLPLLNIFNTKNQIFLALYSMGYDTDTIDTFYNKHTLILKTF